MGGVCSEAIESQNVVGYASDTTVEQNNFKALSFNSIGCNTADIQQIKISDGNNGGIGWGGETFDIWEGAPTTVAGSNFIYCDASLDPKAEATDYYWGDDAGNKATFSIAVGQGVVLGLSADLSVTVAGQVPTGDVNFTTIDGNNFTGNPFPAAIDIQQIKISDGNNGSIGWGGETFDIWEGAPTTVAGSNFIYCDASLDPKAEATDYYWGDDAGNKVSYSIPGGQGVVIGCSADLSITIAAPYSL